ncbi:heavy metal-binding protein HIP-like [Saccostrea cucullata]|uniref:heavy metal-binding protein HIP-like n=1 Tax=Saccostrea cuccullata TaxID=36930 RepID=UPI002ED44091
MKRNMLCLLLFSLILIQINGISILTGENNNQGDQMDRNVVPTKRVDILQQLLNQETIIRMSLEKNVRDLIKEVANMKTKITMLETSTRELNGNVNRSLEIMDNELISRHKQLSENVSNLDMIHRDKQGVIAFNALLTDNTHQSKAVIIFKKITLNSGNAYNATTGKFTAPVDGIYSFSWTIATDAGQRLSTEIIHIDKPVSYNHVYGNYETGSTTANIEMKKNEQVWIRAYEGGFALTDWSSFSGFQLK